MRPIKTRMGDGYDVEMTPEEVRADLVAGSEDAAKKGKIPTLDADDYDYLYEMFASPSRIWGVERGQPAGSPRKPRGIGGGRIGWAISR